MFIGLGVRFQVNDDRHRIATYQPLAWKAVTTPARLKPPRRRLVIIVQSLVENAEFFARPERKEGEGRNLVELAQSEKFTQREGRSFSSLESR